MKLYGSRFNIKHIASTVIQYLLFFNKNSYRNSNIASHALTCHEKAKMLKNMTLTMLIGCFNHLST